MDSDVGKLFIGGISWETTEDKLRSYFGSYGEVVEAVIMKDRTTGRARGFGFVVFADPLVADRVVQEKHTIDGRQVEAKKAVPRDEQQNAVRSSNGGLAPMTQTKTKKIFVGGLAATVSEHDFRKYFEQFGSITDVVVMYDHATQRPRGFGFITFESEDSVDRVLQKSFHELKGKMVEVKRAIPKEMSPSPVRNNGGGMSTGLRGGGPYAGGYGQFGSNPMVPFGSRLDSRYGPSPGPGYSPYAGVGYGSGRNFMYNGNPYGSTNMNFGRTLGHSGAMSSGGSFVSNGGGYGVSPGAGGYGNTTPGRNLWSTGGVGYGNSSVTGGYGYNGGSSMGNYGGVGTWSTTQSSTSSAAYGSNNLTYGSNGGSYGSNNLGYSGRGATNYGNSLSGYSSLGNSNSVSSTQEGSYRDLYNNLGYRETTYKSSSGSDPFNSVNIADSGFGDYGLGESRSEAGSGGYGGGYATARQSHRGMPT